jgi:hypothetical protein
MSLCSAVLIAIEFSTRLNNTVNIGDVFKIAVYHYPLLFYIGITCTPIDFNEQASRIQGPRTNFAVSLRPSNSLLEILKNIY